MTNKVKKHIKALKKPIADRARNYYKGFAEYLKVGGRDWD